MSKTSPQAKAQENKPEVEVKTAPAPSKKKVIFELTKAGYILKGKTIEETNNYCRAKHITFADLKAHTKDNVAEIDE